MVSSKHIQISNALNSVSDCIILQPDSEQYQEDNGSYFNAFEVETKPLYIAKPSSVQQVQGLVKALCPSIISGDCQIAVRGTGHTPFAGSANVEGGVTIDMRGLKGINLSQDESTVRIGVGETWATVYAELEQHGLTTAGGRVGRIGVAGFILGGESNVKEMLGGMCH